MWQNRAKVEGELRTRRIAMRMRPETANHIQTLAKFNGTSSTNLIEMLVDAEWERNKNNSRIKEIEKALKTLENT